MDVPTFFATFLTAIRPDEEQRKLMTKEHTLLRERLRHEPVLKDRILGTFIQGSNRRHTGLKGETGHPADVDIVVVTDFPRRDETAAAAHAAFQPFLERHYEGRYEAQDRSWCIRVSDEVKLDLVPTSQPTQTLQESLKARGIMDWSFPEERGWSFSADPLSEAVLKEAKAERDFTQEEPLWIPDRMRHKWERTHPLFQISWSAAKNASCNGHYVNVVKAIKWWRRHMQPVPKYPKGYPLEHLVALSCPDGITSVAEGIVRTFEDLESRYAGYAAIKQTPYVPDHWCKEQNVLARVPNEDFAGFHGLVADAAELARRALDAEDREESLRLWHELLGKPFPRPDGVKVGFTPRTEQTEIAGGRYA